MKFRAVAGTVIALGLTTPMAHATIYYDSLQVPGAVIAGNADGQPYGVTFSAESFSASSPDFTQISLELSANTPGDGGSTLVYLVGDDNSSGSIGVAGAPNPVNSGIQIADISDSALSSTPSTVSIWVSPATDALVASTDEEYWVELVYASGSALWYYSSEPPIADGIGLAGQASDDSYNGIHPNNDGDPSADGAYDLVVATPEPAALAIFGAALVGLGYVRRRSVRSA